MCFALKNVNITDHQWLVDLHNDPLILHNITNPTPITLEEHMIWWNSLNEKTQKRFIFTVNNINAGFVKFYNNVKETVEYIKHNNMWIETINKLIM